MSIDIRPWWVIGRILGEDQHAWQAMRLRISDFSRSGGSCACAPLCESVENPPVAAVLSRLYRNHCRIGITCALSGLSLPQ